MWFFYILVRGCCTKSIVGSLGSLSNVSAGCCQEWGFGPKSPRPVWTLARCGPSCRPPSCFSALNRGTILRAVPANRTARRLRTPEYGEESETSESKLMYGRDDSSYGNTTGGESLFAEEPVPGGADGARSVDQGRVVEGHAPFCGEPRRERLELQARRLAGRLWPQLAGVGG